jgi:hypothetical protein
MSTVVFKDCYLSINAVALSDHVQSVTLDYSADEVEDTNMGDNTHKFMPSTLKNWSLEVEFSQDYAASEVDATLFSLVGGSAVTIAVRPTTDAASATNPEFGGAGVVLNYPPISGTVGEKKLASCTIKPSGSSADLTRSTS